MQQMEEPKGRAYNEGYQAEPEYSTDDGNPLYGEFAEQPHQQKLRPESKVRSVLATLSVIASAIIMGLAITLVVLLIVTLVNIGATVVPGQLFVLVLVGLIFAAILLVLAITGFVFSIIQRVLMNKKFPMRRRNRIY